MSPRNAALDDFNSILLLLQRCRHCWQSASVVVRADDNAVQFLWALIGDKWKSTTVSSQPVAGEWLRLPLPPSASQWRNLVSRRQLSIAISSLERVVAAARARLSRFTASSLSQPSDLPPPPQAVVLHRHDTFSVADYFDSVHEIVDLSVYWDRLHGTELLYIAHRDNVSCCSRTECSFLTHSWWSASTLCQ